MIDLYVPEKCQVVGRPLAAVDFPRGAIVGAVLREGEFVVPTGKDVLEAGDEVVVFSVGSAVDEVERLFAP
jgi:trk system potassium uptake protein TrkA